MARVTGSYELSIETSRQQWRLGIARDLLNFFAEPPWIEHITLLAMRLDWHWDLEGTGLDTSEYRGMLQRLFELRGSRTLRTAEPNVLCTTATCCRCTGTQVPPPDRSAAFNEAIYVSPWLRQRRAE
jgi:hypothetical protein